jgi:hypothetical protein
VVAQHEDAYGVRIHPTLLDRLPNIAPGVVGTVEVTATTVTIPVLAARQPGSGAVSAFLASLPDHAEIRIPVVTSPRLAGMLRRRGYELDGGAWVRAPLSRSGATPRR